MIRGIVKFLFIVAVILGIAAAVLRIFFVDLVVVGHNGMAPTVVAGDQIGVWRSASPELGDITICQHPSQPDRFVMGRVIAYAGYKLEVKRGVLYINSQVPDKDYQDPVKFTDITINNGHTDEMAYGIEKFSNTEHEFFERKGAKFNMRTTTVQKGIYLLGDNRTYVGEDSRSFGEVDPTTCKGQVFIRLQPAPPRGDDVKHHWFQLIE
jgi:signal peptidase I